MTEVASVENNKLSEVQSISTNNTPLVSEPKNEVINTNTIVGGGNKGVFKKFLELYMKTIEKYKNILFAIVVPTVFYIAHVNKTFEKLAKKLKKD
jgi:hypothetical protein